MQNKVPIVSELLHVRTPPSRTHPPGGPDHSSNPSYAMHWLTVLDTMWMYQGFSYWEMGKETVLLLSQYPQTWWWTNLRWPRHHVSMPGPPQSGTPQTVPFPPKEEFVMAMKELNQMKDEIRHLKANLLHKLRHCLTSRDIATCYTFYSRENLNFSADACRHSYYLSTNAYL